VGGLEVSAFAACYGREQLGLNIVEGMVDALHLGQLAPSYDLITMWDVAEHLPDPADAIELLSARLAPGGVLALSTGDVRSLAARLCGRRWHLYNLPEHLWFFTEESLRLLLARAGLTVECVRREVCWYTARYLLDRLMYTLGRPPLTLARARLCERITLPFTLFDIVTIHARKPVGAGGTRSIDINAKSAKSAKSAKDAKKVVAVPV
jgi:SAM-dependent methyltransferase